MEFRPAIRVLLSVGFAFASVSADTSDTESSTPVGETPAAETVESPRLDLRSLDTSQIELERREAVATPASWSKATFWFGAAADLYTTKRALDTPGLYEANPLLGQVGSDDDTAVLLTAAAFKGVTYWLLRRSARRGWLSKRQVDGLLTGLGAGQTLAAVHNLDKVDGN